MQQQQEPPLVLSQTIDGIAIESERKTKEQLRSQQEEIIQEDGDGAAFEGSD